MSGVLDLLAGAPRAARVDRPVDVAVCFGNSSVRLLVRDVDGGGARALNFPHPHPAAWGAAWLPAAGGAERPTPESLCARLLGLLDAERLTARSLVVVVSGRVRHAAGVVELSFMLGEAFTDCALLARLRASLPRARPAGLALVNDTACSAVEGYLALAREAAAGGAGAPALLPALVVDAGTGCFFAYVSACAGSRVGVLLLEPWASREVGAAGEALPLWRAVSDEALRGVGAAAWNARLRLALAAVLRWLAEAAGGPLGMASVYITGGNSTAVERETAEAAAPGLRVRGLPLPGEPALSRDALRSRYLHAALAVGSMAHLLDVRNVGEALAPGGVLLA